MEEQLKLLRGRLEALAEQADSIFDQLNELFEQSYNDFLENAEDPDAEETLDAASVWDQVFDETTSLSEAIDAIDAALGEE